MRFSRILCAFDDSPSAGAALALATDLAEGGAKLLLARVVERERVVEDIGNVPGAARIANDAMAASERDLELVRRAVAETVPGAAAVTLGGASVWRALTSEAKRWGADLVVIGAGSRRRGIIGATAQRVVRHTKCAVLVVSGSVRPIARIVCAVDFSSPARGAMQVASELAAERSAELTLAHASSEVDGRDAAEATLRRWAAGPIVRS